MGSRIPYLFLLGGRDHDENGAFHDVVVRIECQVVGAVCAVMLAELIYYELVSATYYQILVAVKGILFYT